MSGNETIDVHHKKGEEETIEKLKWPQNYENFIQDIIEKFNLKKNSKIELQLITNDEDDAYINSQDELNPYLDEGGVGIQYFNVLFEGGSDPLDEGDNNGNPVPIEDIKIEQLNFDEFMKDVFTFEEYKKNLKSDTEKISTNFKNTLEKSINDILVENKNNMEKSLDLELSQYLNMSQEKIKSIKNSVLDFSDEIREIKEKTEKMSGAISELKDSIQSKELILSNAGVLQSLNNNNKKNNNIPAQKNELEVSEVQNSNPNPLNGILDEDNNNDKDKNKILKIKFEQKNIEKIIEMKDAKYININDIKIKNEGNRSAHKLFFVKNKEKSSNDFCFYVNSKATDEYKLSMPGELKPNESLNFNISMNINNPKPGQEYKAIINAKENDEIISESFEIIIKINKPKEEIDPMKQKQNKANQIYEEIKNRFAAHEDLVNKDNIINKLMNNNLNKDEIINDINKAIKEKEQKEINEKAEKVYNELNMDNVNLDKKEVLDYIKENQFNKEEVQNWIDSKKPKEEPQPQPNPAPNPANDDFEKKVDEIYKELEEEYGISGFIEEEAAKEKIRELKLDRAAINEWIENTLINGQ